MQYVLRFQTTSFWFSIGKTIAEKLQYVREKMTEKNTNMLVITALDSVACMLFIIIYSYFIFSY